MFPSRLLLKSSKEFKFLGAGPPLLTVLKVSSTTKFMADYDLGDAATLQKQK